MSLYAVAFKDPVGTVLNRYWACELKRWWEQSTRKGYGQELPARDLQRCLLTLFRHPLNPFSRRGVDELTGT